jgi:glycosyltransferase involved in cell wall biosynthesis
MLSRDPRITIIVATLNCRNTLLRCVQSVIDQDYPHKEIIIIDGGSSDGTQDVIRGLDSPVISHRESAPDRGIYHAWNKGLRYACGDWINFLGADDYFVESGVIGKIASGLRNCPQDILVAYGREAVVSPYGEVLEINGAPWREVGGRFTIEMSIPHPAVFHRESLFRDYGVFDESFKIAGDYELLLRVLKNGKADFLSDVVVKAVDYRGTSRRPEMLLILARELVRAKKMNNVPPYTGGSLGQLSKILVKSILQRLLGQRTSAGLVDAYRRLTGRTPIWRKIYCPKFTRFDSSPMSTPLPALPDKGSI